MISIPVKLFGATESKDLAFNNLHTTCKSRLKQKRWCPVDDREVFMDEITKAYEYSKDSYVDITDEDLDALPVPSKHTIELTSFVKQAEIDPVYFERTYYLGPEEGAGEAIYALLVEAMERSGLSAIATYVHHDRENLACLRVRDGVITLEKMFFEDEIRSIDGIVPGSTKVDSKQLKMAEDLIGAYTSDFEPERYKDTYRERLLAIVDQKRQGKTTKVPEPEAGPSAPDLLTALTASLDAARAERQKSQKPAKKATASKSRAKAGAGGSSRRKTA